MKKNALHIDEIELFKILSVRKKARLRLISKKTLYKKGEFVYLPGDASENLYIVADGRIKVSKISESGKELTLSFHNPGEMFGELALVHDHPRRSVAVATVSSEIWVVPKNEFNEIVLSSPQFAFLLSSIIGHRRHDLENRMEGLVFKDVPSRLANQILLLARKYGKKNGNETIIHLKLSQLELANLIGATRETTSTAINEMKRSGIIEISQKNIIIKNMEALLVLKESI